jgi:hypothetical protein
MLQLVQCIHGALAEYVTRSAPTRKLAQHVTLVPSPLTSVAVYIVIDACLEDVELFVYRTPQHSFMPDAQA